MIPLMFWLGEFMLEASGAFFAFRRRLKVLGIYLAFSAASDVITFALRNQHPAYGYASWAQEAVQCLLAVVLAAQIVSTWIRDSGVAKLTFWASAIGGILTVKAFLLADTWPHRFMDAEIAASMSAGVVVCLGWLTRKKPLEGPWNLIASGLIISLAGNGLLAMLSYVWFSALVLYPIPALAALITWNWAASQRKLGEFRRVVPPKFAPESVRVPRQQSRMVQ